MCGRLFSRKVLSMSTPTWSDTKMTAVADLKRTHRTIWASGDYPAVAEVIDDVPPRDLLGRIDIQPGEDVLDVATGSGNIALRAAAAGARVVGLDLTPELFATARRREAQYGVTVDWVEGDAEDLPYEDESFDHVLSTFGVQFAPRHEVVAHERARVCRPGGTIGLVNWTPQGQVGEVLRTIGGYMPKPPQFASPPPLWGTEQHIRDLFAGTGVQFEFARGLNPWQFDSPEHYVVFMETHYGPVLKARERLTGEGRWEDCRAEILANVQRRNEATDGSLLMHAEYLVAIGRKAGA
jgi:SAM-dependent methyltransferase